MYDYYLGGAHNFAVDRELAEKALRAMPDGRALARANRAFLQRSVRFLTRAGIRQFLDIGSGIPTVGNVHEVAQRIAPDARVAYAGFGLLEPGVVWAPQWHPDQPEDVGTQPERSGSYVGVGRRP